MPGCSRSREKFDAIAETSQFADHLARAHFLRLRADRRPAFLVPYALVQDLPDQSTQPVSDGTDRLRMLAVNLRKKVVAIEKSIRRHIRAVRVLSDDCQASPGIPQSPATGMRMPVNSQFESATAPEDRAVPGCLVLATRRPWLCRDAVVTVMQTADFWNGDNATG